VRKQWVPQQHQVDEDDYQALEKSVQDWKDWCEERGIDLTTIPNLGAFSYGFQYGMAWRQFKWEKGFGRKSKRRVKSGSR